MLLETLKSLASAKNASLSQLVLRWTIDQPGNTIALVGARDAAQAVENAAAISVNISQEENDFIRAEVNKVQIVKP